jgi:hypothetical protein
LLINDQVRQLFYIYSVSGSSSSTFGGMGVAASWTPDSKTLYIADSAAENLVPQVIAAGTNHHSDTLYVYNANTGWTTSPLPCSVYNKDTCPNPSTGAQSVALTIPGVGAYTSGNPTVAHTWCPTGTVANGVSTISSFYPLGDSVSTQTDVLAATIDGQHILGAALNGSEITLSDIGVQVPVGECPSTTTGTYPNQTTTLQALTIPHTDTKNPFSTFTTAGVNAGSVSQVVPAPNSGLAFITYNPPQAGATGKAPLPYYVPGSAAVNYVTLSNNTDITAPLAGAFTPDNSLFFVSTAGDNLVHYISIPKNVTSSAPPTDTQQIAPNLPACIPVSAGGADAGCTYTGTGSVVPTTAIAVKPRSTT